MAGAPPDAIEPLVDPQPVEAAPRGRLRVAAIAMFVVTQAAWLLGLLWLLLALFR